jgi:hypothetical protein
MIYFFKILGRFIVALFKTIGYILEALTSSSNQPTDDRRVEKKKYIPKKQIISNEIAKEKGANFEQYIVKKFDKSLFHLKEWRGDKYINGLYAESNLNPDLEYEFRFNNFKSTFALECKYRQNSYNGQIELGKERQITHYKQYEKDRKMPVYIALGLGGNPSNPTELFLIPLKYLNNNKISCDTLSSFKKETHGQFYFNIKANALC